MRSSTLIHAYQRSRFLRNAVLASLGVLIGATILWVSPWGPWGFTADDFSTKSAVAVGLGFAAMLAGFGFVYLRDETNRHEQTLLTWSSVRDELGDLRRREYLYERTVIECMRAERTAVPFGVFAVRFGGAEGVNSAQTASALEALPGLIRQSDSLAALGPQEVGVLGAGMGAREAPAFAYRLKSTIETATGTAGHDQVSVGWAIWGTDGTDADTLVGLARSRMQHKTALREWARELETEGPPEASFGAGSAPPPVTPGSATRPRNGTEPANDTASGGRFHVIRQPDEDQKDSGVA